MTFSFSSICRVKFKFCPRYLTSIVTASRRSSTQGAEIFVYLVSYRNQTPTVTESFAYCVGSIFDANQQNKTRLMNLFYYRDVITFAKLKSWAPCVCSASTNFALTYPNSAIIIKRKGRLSLSDICKLCSI